MRSLAGLILFALLISGCRDDRTVGPPGPPPAAPRGLHTVTGDHAAYLSWLDNTERNVTGYRIYGSGCGDPDCVYDFIGATTGTSYTVTGLTNGQTRYFAVSAVDDDGLESDLSYDIIYDTPRPEGTGLVLSNFMADSAHAGYEFSTFSVLPYSSTHIDIYYGNDGSLALMVAPYPDTEIQDAGYANTLDAVDFAPPAGWSPTGSVELIPGHCYIVKAQGNHYAKFRVTSMSATEVVVDWAYQVAAGNRELRARPDQGGERPRGERRPFKSPLGA